jgi:hypothetical protein
VLQVLRAICVQAYAAIHPIPDTRIVAGRTTRVDFKLAKRLFSDPDLALVRPGGYLRLRRAASVAEDWLGARRAKETELRDVGAAVP